MFFVVLEIVGREDGRRRCLLIPEGESISPVFPDASEIFLLRSSDWAGNCTFTEALTSARPALAEEESVAVEWHFSSLDTGKHRVTSSRPPTTAILLFSPALHVSGLHSALLFGPQSHI